MFTTKNGSNVFMHVQSSLIPDNIDKNLFLIKHIRASEPHKILKRGVTDSLSPPIG